MSNLKFDNVSNTLFQKLTKELSNFGIDIEGDEGEIAAKGFTGSFKRDDSSNQLDIKIDKTPFILPKKLVLRKIKDLIEKNGGKLLTHK